MNKTELSVSQLLEDRVCLEVESIDRMYLNVYVPGLQRELGMVSYIKYHLSQPVPSTVVVADQSRAFVKAIRRFVEDEGIPLVRFKKGQRKEDIAREHLKRFKGNEGLVFVGSAQEKAIVFRIQRRRRPDTGSALSVDRSFHGHGQSLLLLLRGQGIRSVLPQVLYLLPLHGQAVPQWP